MAKLQIVKFVTEVAPPKIICVIKRPFVKILDTINEEEAYVAGLSSVYDRSKDRARMKA